MTVSPMTTQAAPLTINACNNGGNHCGMSDVTVTLLNATSGTTVTTSGVQNNLSVGLRSSTNGVFTFRITAASSTRTANSFTFTAGACGSRTMHVRTQ